jgi:hypothetical protein
MLKLGVTTETSMLLDAVKFFLSRRVDVFYHEGKTPPQGGSETAAEAVAALRTEPTFRKTGPRLSAPTRIP